MVRMNGSRHGDKVVKRILEGSSRYGFKPDREEAGE
jgi:hypothetical protein